MKIKLSLQKNLILTFALSTFCFFLPSPAMAYIDPGSGMAFVSGVGAWLAAFFALCFGFIAMTAKRWWAFIKGLFSRKR